MALSKVQALTRDHSTTNFASKILLLGPRVENGPPESIFNNFNCLSFYSVLRFNFRHLVRINATRLVAFHMSQLHNLRTVRVPFLLKTRKLNASFSFPISLTKNESRRIQIQIQKTAENLCSQANPIPKHIVWEPYWIKLFSWCQIENFAVYCLVIHKLHTATRLCTMSFVLAPFPQKLHPTAFIIIFSSRFFF